jgi:hypothetical protein
MVAKAMSVFCAPLARRLQEIYLAFEDDGDAKVCRCHEG